jgi:fatty acid desaturase
MAEPLASTSRAAVAASAAGSQLDVLAVLHDLQRPSPAIYWIDLLGSAAAGWLAFAVACTSASTPVTVAAALAGILLLYRAHLFIHELSHAARHIRGFSTAWNLVAGLPLLVPSSFAVGVHAAHHRPSTYGTAADPEYLPFGRSRLLIVRFIFLNLAFPLAMALRFLVIGPIALLVPPLQRFLERLATSLALLWLTWSGAIGVRVVLCWAMVATGIALTNGIRTLGAHRYLAGGNAMDRQGQRDDSIDTPGRWWTTIWAPVGHRYHAVHHFMPGLPYHNLGEAYRRLEASRPPGMSFGDTSPSLLASLAQLWSAASSRRTGNA